jgi:hypothetical protein
MTTPQETTMSTQDSAQLDPLADTLADGFDDDWDVAPPPRRRLHWTTAVLLVALSIVAAFAGGIFAQKHWGGSSSAGFTLPNGGSLPAGFPGAATGGTAPTGGRSGSTTGLPAGLTQGGFGGGTRGTVSYVDGNILYVSTGTGGVVKVRIPKGLSVDRTVTAKASSIRPGETVVVQGATGTNGTVKATGISVTAS